MPIKINSAHCSHCDETITSRFRHDWVTCKCWKNPENEGDTIRHHGIFVDGGFDYMRHGWSKESEYTNKSEWIDE